MANILVVDDEKSIRITLGEFLRADGHEVRVAEDVMAATELMAAEEFDVVLTDIILPRVSGVDLLKTIRESLPHSLVIMMTGEPTIETAAESVRAGAFDYLAKPITKEIALKTVRNALKVKALNDEKQRLEAENRRYQQDLEHMVEERTEQLSAEKARAQRLNLVLRAVRNVNQLITKEKDRGRMVQGACEILTRDRGYAGAWIVLLDEKQRATTTAESGLGTTFEPMAEQLRRGELTQCARAALSLGEVIVDDPVAECADCPLASQYSGRVAVSVRLEHEGKVLGLITVSVPREFAHDEEELSLFKEAAADIAFALHSIETETKRRGTEEVLRESEVKHRRLHSMLRLMCDNLPELIWAKDLQSKFLFANRACCEELLNARDTDEPIGKDDVFFANREIQSHPENPSYHSFGETCTDSDSAVLESRKAIRSLESGNVKGEFTVFDVQKAPFLDEGGTLIGTVGTSRDVTKEREIENARKRAEEELALHREHLEELVEERTAELVRAREITEAIHEILERSLTCENERDVARTTLEVAERLTGSAFGFIGEFNQDGLVDGMTISDPGWKACRLPESEADSALLNMKLRGIWAKVLTQTGSQIVNDPASDPDSVGTPDGHPELTSFLGVPLLKKGEAFGLIALANKETGYDETDRTTVESLAVAFTEALMRVRVEVAAKRSNDTLRKAVNLMAGRENRMADLKMEIGAAREEVRRLEEEVRRVKCEG